MCASLNISCWNARGIRNKSIEFFAYLSKYNIDVSLVSETFLNVDVNLSNKDYR